MKEFADCISKNVDFSGIAPQPKDFDTFEAYEAAWHAWMRPKQKPDSMYFDGQFDEIPFVEWAKSGGSFTLV